MKITLCNGRYFKEVKMKYYVVSDVHGFYTELIDALTEKGFFEDKEEHKLIVCGDLFDRGIEAEKLQSFIAELLEKDKVVLVRGNHEDLALDFVDNYKRWLNSSILYTHHWKNGTVKTMLELTKMDLIEACDNPIKFFTKAINTPYFTKIIPSMKNYFETDKYIFVHGWIVCDALGYGGRPNTFIYKDNWREGDNADWKFARWFNGMEAARQGVIELDKTIICGHWHTSFGHSKIEGKGEEFGKDADFSPYYNKGIIAIDGCIALTRKVNVIVIND